MVLVGKLAFEIHPARIPVAALTGSLRSEVNPEAELGFPQPGRIGGIVFADRIPRRLERPRGHGEIRLDLREGIGIPHLHTAGRFRSGHRRDGRQLRRQCLGDQRKREQP